jgi:hypothetical protein
MATALRFGRFFEPLRQFHVFRSDSRILCLASASWNVAARGQDFFRIRSSAHCQPDWPVVDPPTSSFGDADADDRMRKRASS